MTVSPTQTFAANPPAGYDWVRWGQLSEAERDRVERDATVPSEDLTFWDALDLVNPLQHIPIVSHFYREATGDTIKPSIRVMGSAIIGGPIGLGIGATTAMIEDANDKSITQMVADAFSGDADAAPIVATDAVRPNAQLASADPDDAALLAAAGAAGTVVAPLRQASSQPDVIPTTGNPTGARWTAPGRVVETAAAPRRTPTSAPATAVASDFRPVARPSVPGPTTAIITVAQASTAPVASDPAPAARPTERPAEHTAIANAQDSRAPTPAPRSVPSSPPLDSQAQHPAVVAAGSVIPVSAAAVRAANATAARADARPDARPIQLAAIRPDVDAQASRGPTTYFQRLQNPQGARGSQATPGPVTGLAPRGVTAAGGLGEPVAPGLRGAVLARRSDASSAISAPTAIVNSAPITRPAETGEGTQAGAQPTTTSPAPRADAAPATTPATSPATSPIAAATEAPIATPDGVVHPVPRDQIANQMIQAIDRYRSIARIGDRRVTPVGGGVF